MNQEVIVSQSGLLLKKELERLNRSQKELAWQLGYSPYTISKICLGKRKVSWEMYDQLRDKRIAVDRSWADAMAADLAFKTLA